MIEGRIVLNLQPCSLLIEKLNDFSETFEFSDLLLEFSHALDDDLLELAYDEDDRDDDGDKLS